MRYNCFCAVRRNSLTNCGNSCYILPQFIILRFIYCQLHEKMVTVRWDRLKIIKIFIKFKLGKGPKANHEKDGLFLTLHLVCNFSCFLTLVVNRKYCDHQKKNFFLWISTFKTSLSQKNAFLEIFFFCVCECLR